MNPSNSPSVPASRADKPEGASVWKSLAPLPDPVGYGGMMAGVLGGRLVAGGGSQFPHRPLWLKGEKLFSDRLYSLSAPESGWTEESVKLPLRVGHAASASTKTALSFAGGLDDTGPLKQTWSIRADGDKFVFVRLPDLPRGLGYASAAIMDERFYVIGGQHVLAERVLSREIWSLDLRPAAVENTWRREADLPETGMFLAAVGSHAGRLYVFGGVSFDGEGKAVQSAKAWCLAPQQGRWERLADLPAPRVGAATPCEPLSGGKFLMVGGYAKSFAGAPREHPGFDQETFVYDVAANIWTNGPILPKAPVTDRDFPGDMGPSPMVAAPGVLWRDHVVVVSGEVRASVRSPAVLAWPVPGLISAR